MYEQCKIFLALLDPVTNVGAKALCSGNKKKTLKWEQDLLYKKQKKEKQGKRQNKGTDHVLKIYSTKYGSTPTTHGSLSRTFKYVSCQTEVRRLNDLLDTELNKPDVLFHLKTALFHKAFLWNILDHMGP